MSNMIFLHGEREFWLDSDKIETIDELPGKNGSVICTQNREYEVKESPEQILAQM